MKKLLNIRSIFLLFATLFSYFMQAQETEKPELLVNLQYYNLNGSIQYLKVKTMVKEDNKLQPVTEAKLQLYLDEVAPGNLIGKIKTDYKGESKIAIRPAVKDQWNDTPDHKFIAVSEATKKFDETTTELDIIKAKIVIDTLNEEGVRKLSAQLLAFENGEWVPAKEVEVKMGVRRLGGDIKIGEEETYTTDSLGQVVGEFLLDKLPAADSKNNLTLVVKTEDNELYGNLSVEKTVPWGAFVQQPNNFNKRSLFGTSDKTPIWLLFMVYSILAGVWGVIFYLVFLLIKIRKAGKRSSQSVPAAPSELETAEV